MTALTGLSRAELALGDRSGAWEHAIQALRLCHEETSYTFIYIKPRQFALLLADKGDIYQALELYGLASRQITLANSRWFADLCGGKLKSGLPFDFEEQAEAEGLARR
ncbi:MAG: hypothetical protein M0C28_30735 [Candidatus Moduliflexus flocculans]|nr:hypothetical protein [Candidatus Moduliflexus flocculans]